MTVIPAKIRTPYLTPDVSLRRNITRRTSLDPSHKGCIQSRELVKFNRSIAFPGISDDESQTKKMALRQCSENTTSGPQAAFTHSMSAHYRSIDNVLRELVDQIHYFLVALKGRTR